MRIYITFFLIILVGTACVKDDDVNRNWFYNGFFDELPGEKPSLSSLLAVDFVSGPFLANNEKGEKVQLLNCMDLFHYQDKLIGFTGLLLHDKHILLKQNLRCLALQEFIEKPSNETEIDYFSEIIMTPEFVEVYRRAFDRGVETFSDQFKLPSLNQAEDKGCSTKWDCFVLYDYLDVGFTYLFKKDVNNDGNKELVVFFSEKYRQGRGASFFLAYLSKDREGLIRLVEIRY